MLWGRIALSLRSPDITQFLDINLGYAKTQSTQGRNLAKTRRPYFLNIHYENTIASMIRTGLPTGYSCGNFKYSVTYLQAEKGKD